MTDKQNYFTYTDNTTDDNDKTMENLHKQIIIDGVDVSWCEHYTGNIGYLTDKNWTCRAKIQGTKCEDWSNCYFKNWKRKEQECERLEEANNTLTVIREKLLGDLWIAEESLKDYKEHYDKQCEQLEAYKMEADEGKEINAELKAENDNLKSLIWWIHVGAEGADKATTEYYENRNTPYEENYWKRIRALQPPTYESKYKLALTKIKEIAEPYYTLGSKDSPVAQILQKISEVENGKNS